jgi:hypothetical protein
MADKENEEPGKEPTLLEEMLLAVRDQDEQDDEDLSDALGVTDSDDDGDADADPSSS